MSKAKPVPDLDVDVAIIGAGPAGSALSIALSEMGFSSGLLDQAWLDQAKVGESIVPAVKPLLESLGAWDDFQSLKPLPSFGTRSVWGDAQARSHSHLSSAFNQGWHVDRQQTDAMLANQAQQRGAVLQLGVKVGSIRYDHKQWSLTLVQAKQVVGSIKARMLVDSSGRNASLAMRLSAKRILLDRLVAVCQRLTTPVAHDERHIALETCRDGWWYSAPVSEQALMFMLMTDSDLCKRGEHRHQFTTLMQRTSLTARRVKQHDPITVGLPFVVSAVSQRLNRYDDDRPWLATGDAALSVDPISGSGFIRALEAAEHSARCIEQYLKGRPVSRVLERHERHLDDQCTHYLVERAAYYGAERRWLEHPFWARRQVSDQPSSQSA